VIKILTILQTDNTPDGLEVDEIVNRLGGTSINDVQIALNFLQNQSQVYTGMDEKRYKASVL
jgi:hypothetical protein